MLDSLLASVIFLAGVLVPHHSDKPTLGSDWIVYAIDAALALALVLRRRYPFAVLGVVLLSSAVV